MQGRITRTVLIRNDQASCELDFWGFSWRTVREAHFSLVSKSMRSGKVVVCQMKLRILPGLFFAYIIRFV